MLNVLESWILKRTRSMTQDTQELSVLELVGSTAHKMNELVVYVNNLIEIGITQPLIEQLQKLADSGELGRLIQEIIVIDGGEF